MRSSLSAFLVVMMLGATGCVTHAKYSQVDLDHQERFGVVEVSNSFSYIIDPRTESCFLRQSGLEYNFALAPVSCASLKKNVPEAAEYITWDVANTPAASATAAQGTP